MVLSIILASVFLLSNLLMLIFVGYGKISRTIFGIFLIVQSWCFKNVLMDIYPTALDVYRDKTELKVNTEITGKDTLIVDSIVVFKN